MRICPRKLLDYPVARKLCPMLNISVWQTWRSFATNIIPVLLIHNLRFGGVGCSGHSALLNLYLSSDFIRGWLTMSIVDASIDIWFVLKWIAPPRKIWQFSDNSFSSLDSFLPWMIAMTRGGIRWASYTQRGGRGKPNKPIETFGIDGFLTSFCEEKTTPPGQAWDPGRGMGVPCCAVWPTIMFFKRGLGLERWIIYYTTGLPPCLVFLCAWRDLMGLNLFIGKKKDTRTCLVEFTVNCEGQRYEN